MKFFPCLLLLMVIGLSMDIALLAKVKTGSSAQSVEDNGVKFNPYLPLIVSLKVGHLYSDALYLEKNILEKEIVRNLFTQQKLEDDQLNWNFNAIIGIQMATWLIMPDLKEALQMAMAEWTENLTIIMSVVNNDKIKELKELVASGKYVSDVYKEILTLYPNKIEDERKRESMKLTGDQFEKLYEVVRMRIAMELLLTVMPKNQQALFINLLKYYKEGQFDDIHKVANENRNEKFGAHFEKTKAEDSNSQSSTTRTSFDSYYISLGAGQELSKMLELKKKVLGKQDIKKLITSTTLEKNPRLQWLLESLIGIETAISYYFRKNDKQKQVFDFAIAVWQKYFCFPKDGEIVGLPSAEIERKLPETVEKRSTNSAIQDIIEEALQNQKMTLRAEEKTTLGSYLELRLSVYVMFSIVPEAEGRLLKKVFTYFRDSKLFDDIADGKNVDIFKLIKK